MLWALGANIRYGGHGHERGTLENGSGVRGDATPSPERPAREGTILSK